MKNNNGITLIALVITIIVLLILAGVSIAMIGGTNGILGRATDAKIRTAISEAGDQVSLEIADMQTEYYNKVYVENDATVKGQTRQEYMDAALTTKYGTAATVGSCSVSYADETITITYDGYASTATLDDGTIGTWSVPAEVAE